MNIYYGILDNKMDVTDICLDQLIKQYHPEILIKQ
jgi:hypothetical protein